jgi:hypothetical protein
MHAAWRHLHNKVIDITQGQLYPDTLSTPTSYYSSSQHMQHVVLHTQAAVLIRVTVLGTAEGAGHLRADVQKTSPSICISRSHESVHYARPVTAPLHKTTLHNTTQQKADVLSANSTCHEQLHAAIAGTQPPSHRCTGPTWMTPAMLSWPAALASHVWASARPAQNAAGQQVTHNYTPHNRCCKPSKSSAVLNCSRHT